MMHSVPRTFSPSSFRITRSTPCVEGCCGPILRTNSVESRNVWSGIPASVAALDTQILPYPLIVLLKNTVILAQRMALPFFGQQNSRHIRVPRELDAEHVEDLALEPVGGQVDFHRGLGLVAVSDMRFHSQPLVPRKAVTNVDHVETLGALGPIHRRDIYQVIEIGFELQMFQHRN